MLQQFLHIMKKVTIFPILFVEGILSSTQKHNFYMKLWMLTILVVLHFTTFAQVVNPSPQLPKAGSLSPYSNTTPKISPSLLQQRAEQTQRNNERLRQEAHRHQYDKFPEEEVPIYIQYEFPSLSHREGTESYYTAFDSIEEMLQDKSSLSLKEAVFLVEHAFLGDRIPKEWFDNAIADNANLIREALASDGYKLENEMAVKMMLHRFMSDTIKICGEDGTICNTIPLAKYFGKSCIFWDEIRTE